jgi:hypothetical protein
MLPKSSVPHIFAVKWIEKYGHASHNTQWASEYDEEFEARVHGSEIISYGYYGPETRRVAEPYNDVTKQTLE